ncbi:MAG TPA: beta-L-arabinofuranosidase domain-containing protein [Anaerolineales bacterium]|nr:beta-L-arabinofuranosidase domain-containing protein [Anaerolineales bacterium]
MFPPNRDRSPTFGPVDASKSSHACWKTLEFKSVSLYEGFWTKKLKVNRETSLRFGFEMLEKSGNFDNLRIAAGSIKGNYRGYVFQDSDIYKWLEAIAWELGKEPDKDLLSMADQAIALIAAAQRSDGYINSYVQTREFPEPWRDLDNGHELYCAGHLFQAAIAFQRTLGDDRLLNIACRFADYICSVFGPDKRHGTCGHPEVEMALIELYRETGESPYLDLAKFFIDQRGRNMMKGHRSYGSEYHQDHVPVRQVVEAAGHAVRQLYLASGVTDLYLETGEQSLFDAMLRLSKDLVETKLYITGGLGSRFDGEAFGDPYELPADQCYCETCAAIAGFMWNWRMLLTSGEGHYADLMEQALYNNILASPALDGKHYFYINPLMLRDARYLRLSTDLSENESFIPDERPEWHDCACCPPNVMRLFSSLTHYLSTRDANGIQIHHFAPADIECDLASGQRVKLNLMTDYPWQGQIKLRIAETGNSPWTLSLRVPEWSQQPTLSVNGNAVRDLNLAKRYLVLERTWRTGDTIDLDLKMEPMLIASNPRIDATRDCLAVQRGPVVYCLEDRDQEIKRHLLDVEVDKSYPLVTRWESDLLDGVMVIDAQGQFVEREAWRGHLYQPATLSGKAIASPVRLIAIPYYAWGNRGIGGMRVWIPKKLL